MYRAAIAIVGGYVLGSLPSAYIAGRLRKGIDIRQAGTQNMGTMNVIYEVGIIEGVLVLLADTGKGIGAICLAREMGLSTITQLSAAAASVIGHSFPLFLRFSGGKGGATSLGILLFLMPKTIPFYLGIAAAALLATRNLTFCYSVALVCFPFAAWLIYQSGTLIIFSVVLLLYLVANNWSGIIRIHRIGWRHAILRTGIRDRR